MILPGWQHVADFVVLAGAFYLVLLWARKNRALRLAVGALSLHVAAEVASRFGVKATVWVLDGAALLLALVLFVLFQPEVRHALVYLDRVLSFGRPDRRALAGVHRAVSDAAFVLAGKGTGALLVLAGGTPISDEVAHGGVALDALVSREMLEVIFLKDSGFHDGAAIIESDRITRAGVLLPLTRRTDLASHLGARHRAALGLAECCDVSVLVVSEERGEVSLVRRRGIRRVENPNELLRRLEESHDRPGAETRTGLRELALSHFALKIGAAALAALLLAVSRMGNQAP